MDHREAAERLLDQLCYTGALAHAILALVDRLEDMPVMGLHVTEGDEDDDE